MGAKVSICFLTKGIKVRLPWKLFIFGSNYKKDLLLVMNNGIIISTSHEYCITMQHAWILLYLTAYNYSNNILVSLYTTHKGGRLNWNYSKGISQFLSSTVYIIVTTLYNYSKICMLFSFNKLKSGSIVLVWLWIEPWITRCKFDNIDLQNIELSNTHNYNYIQC